MSREQPQAPIYNKKALIIFSALSIQKFRAKTCAMEKQETPKPGSKDYDISKTKELTRPKYHSGIDRRTSHQLPATENLNDQPQNKPEEKIKEYGSQKPI